MSFQRTAAPSSRINKNTRQKTLRFSSPRKPASKRKAQDVQHKPHIGDQSGTVESATTIRAALAPELESTDVLTILKYFQSNMFSDIPERASGMNSTRIADILNFRLHLPPIVPIAHIHAISPSPTAMEREIAAKIQRGIIRKVNIPGRGLGALSHGECVVLVSDWEKLVNDTNLASSLKETYISHLHNKPLRPFTPDDLKALSQTGFVTGTASSSISSISPYLDSDASSLGTLSSIASAGHTYASGTSNAAASRAVASLAGGGSVPTPNSIAPSSYVLALPNVGPYLRLVSTARAHLLGLLSKSGGGPNGAVPLGRLRERWEGGVDLTENLLKPVSGVRPGRTKKWRAFYGLRFEWVLAECIGAGLVDGFRTAGGGGLCVRLV
jgi:Serine-threonine protein kinase 19